MAYGITRDMREIAKLKISKTKDYLSSLLIDVDGEKKPVINFVSNSFINPHRYIAEINHRIDAINTYAKEKGLIPIFFTLTLPSEYHRRRRITLKSGKKIFVRNDNYNPDLSVKDGTRKLTKMLSRIRSHRVYKTIDKNRKIYYRVVEPHKDGTPHTHILFYIPPERKERFVRALNNLYPNGYVVADVKDATGYMMKYVLKTLDDLRNGEDKLTDLTYWYVYHGICRLYTSRTLAPLEAYRRLGGYYSLLDLTKKVKSGDVRLWYDRDGERIIAITEDIVDDDGFIIKKDYDLWYKKRRKLEFHGGRPYQKVPSKIVHKKKDCIVPVDTPQGRFYYVGDRLVQPVDIPSRISDPALIAKYWSYDLENDSYAKFAVLHNEMVKRGLIEEDTIFLNDAAMIDHFTQRIIDETQSIF